MKPIDPLLFSYNRAISHRPAGQVQEGLVAQLPGGVTISQMPTPAAQPAISPLWTAASVASAGAGAFHGYRRNDSVPWAVWWSLMGGLFPVVTPAIAVAQGFGKRAKG